MNTGEQLSTQYIDFIPVAIHPTVGLLGHMAVLFLFYFSFFENSKLFFMMVTLIYIFTKNVQGSLFSTLTSTFHVEKFQHETQLLCCLFLFVIPFYQDENDTSLWFQLECLWWLGMLNIFYISVSSLNFSFWEMSIQVFCPFFKIWVFFFFCY
jgi:hypothetical protein